MQTLFLLAVLLLGAPLPEAIAASADYIGSAPLPLREAQENIQRLLAAHAQAGKNFNRAQARVEISRKNFAQQFPGLTPEKLNETQKQHAAALALEQDLSNFQKSFEDLRSAHLAVEALKAKLRREYPSFFREEEDDDGDEEKEEPVERIAPPRGIQVRLPIFSDHESPLKNYLPLGQGRTPEKKSNSWQNGA